MHNNIMVAGSRNRPPMLATGRYAQWQSRQPTTDIPQPEVPEPDTVLKRRDSTNIQHPENKAHYDASNEGTKFPFRALTKPITPPSESAFEEYSDPEQAQKDKKSLQTPKPRIGYYSHEYVTMKIRLSVWESETVTVAGARETIGKKPKRTKDYTYHKEKMLLYKQAEKGVPLQAEQADWLEDKMEEMDEQN
ncbi:hypothetical protein Tco_1111375 [Tanacetum coccineum]|uniref:Uncharacterized protein n=1 Tax=Tanacetum coccineum TaxID=301880 RepID=A0ABQ5INS6_9ASTR